MTLLEILPVEKWIELEMGINKRSNLNASVFDANGIRITNYKKWANRLCPVVKADEKGQSYICAVAHQNAANQAQKTRAPAIVECDAGLVKVVVPIFENDEFLGVAGGCGLLLKDSEVDTFLVDKTTDIDPGEIENLSNDIATISMGKLKSVINYIEEELQWIIHNYHNRRLVSAG
ncbi:PocR ligand-binding domain-containing protein [bacterium]|nr:PocR ligand-binding domain-containing protein [bacterium]